MYSIILFFSASIALYFLPARFAHSRGHRSTHQIFQLNLLAGWTCIGWLVALVWALTTSDAGKAWRYQH